MKQRYSFIHLAAALALSACATTAPPRIIVPPPVFLHTLTVHVYEGDPALDHKAAGAAIGIDNCAEARCNTVADLAGNGNLLSLGTGPYLICASATGYVPRCVPIVVPILAGLDIALERSVTPTIAVRTDGRFFVTDQGTFRPLFQSGLTLLARGPPERDAFLDETVALGFNGIRVFAGDLGWAGQTPASARAALPALLDAAQARGLYVYVCAITGGKDPVYDIEAHLRAIVAIVQGRPNILLEVANEIGHGTLSDTANDIPRLLAIARRVIPSEILWTLGAPLGTDEPTPEGTYPTSGGEFNDAHLDRGRDPMNQARRIREIEAISSALRTPAMSGEPMGADELEGGYCPTEKSASNPDGRCARRKQRRNDPAFFFIIGVLSRGFEVGTVFHSEAGLQGVLLGPQQRACAEAFVAGWKALDTTERLAFVNAGWQNSPVAGADFDNGIVRAYSFITGNRGWTVLVGVKGDPRVQWGGGWRPVDRVAEQAGVQVWSIARK
jgi:hypothetical protein